MEKKITCITDWNAKLEFDHSAATLSGAVFGISDSEELVWLGVNICEDAMKTEITSEHVELILKGVGAVTGIESNKHTALVAIIALILGQHSINNAIPRSSKRGKNNN